MILCVGGGGGDDWLGRICVVFVLFVRPVLSVTKVLSQVV